MPTLTKFIIEWDYCGVRHSHEVISEKEITSMICRTIADGGADFDTEFSIGKIVVEHLYTCTLGLATTKTLAESVPAAVEDTPAPVVAEPATTESTEDTSARSEGAKKAWETKRRKAAERALGGVTKTEIKEECVTKEASTNVVETLADVFPDTEKPKVEEPVAPPNSPTELLTETGLETEDEGDGVGIEDLGDAFDEESK